MVDWCEELQKLQTEDIECGCSIPFMPVAPQESFVDKALRVVMAFLNQRQGSRVRNYGYGRTKSGKQGVCHCLALGECNLMRGGRICRRSNRLTRYCPFRGYFALRKKDGTVSTKLTNAAHLQLLRLLKERKVRESDYV